MKHVVAITIVLFAGYLGGAGCLKNHSMNVVSNPINTNITMTISIKITVGSAVFTATLNDNAAANAFKNLLPLTLDMDELNGNEKFCYLNDSLPTEASNVGTIQLGDLMLYGDTCVVLCYETFKTSYRYTSLGRINDPSGLGKALGTKNVVVKFELP